MTDKKIDRPKRTPLYKQQALSAELRDGYERRWVNDLPGRIQAFQAAGWTLVDDKSQDTSDVRAQDATGLGSAVRRVVNKRTGASCVYGYLMEIPKELYDEDQLEKQKQNDLIDASMSPENQQRSGVADYGTMKRDYN